MAPVGISNDPEDAYAIHPDTSAAEAALRAKLSRKRTKTGCLTCRKRRIKCGEERPVCRNCIKSKRSCEGYNQRVVFKPSFDFRTAAPSAAHINFPAGPIQAPASAWPLEYDQAGPSPPQHPPDFQGFVHQRQDELVNQQPLYFMHAPQAQPVPQYRPQYVGPPVPSPQYQFQGATAPYHGLPVHVVQSQMPMQHFTFTSPPVSTIYPDQPAFLPQNQPHLQTEWQATPTVKFEPRVDVTPPTNGLGHPQISPSSSQSSRTLPGTQAPAVDESSPPWTANSYIPRPELSRPIDQRPPQPLRPPSQQLHVQISDQQAPGPLNARELQLDFYEHERQADPILTPTQFLREAAVETYENGYYDVQTDEEIDGETALLAPADSSRHRSFQRIIEANRINIQDPQTRRYDTFIYPGILERYQPDEVANPLENEATARLFLHFIAVTGPSLSIYERQVRNTSMLFTERDIQFSQQGLWTYTMPLAAMRNKGLLHAMLALASLHVARLTNASETPSLLHYAWALKRIHQSVGNEKQRYKLTTIAASMLLGFYEILTADHVKWNMHLLGSKQLFLETDFCTMTKQFRKLKAERAGRRRGKRKFSLPPHTVAQDTILDQIHDVDERLVSEISGKEVKYDAHGQILTSSASVPQELDLSKFEILRDLYWWYLKQDAYQSIISGNPLMLNYNRWTDCPPRAPLGKSDAVYGTFDHLILLLGRIADFAARDRSRKLKVMEANGGWRPAGAMKMPGPPQAAPPTPVSATTAQQPNGAIFAGPQMPPGNPPMGPQFYGMAPPPRQNVQMPSSYHNLNNLPTPDPVSPLDPIDLHLATQTALEEYGRIRAALHTFTSNLGEPFKPLTADIQQEMETPFGKALFYRSYDIGCLWAIYHMSMIIAIRSHPHMHPAAHVAAAISAEETRFFANEIGRIAAGIVPGPADQPLNPTLGASLCESCMPSFFAAVQYQTNDQRHHTVLRIKSIAQRTGWGSAELIANGCETAWVKAAAAGRGPPYTRIARKEQSDDPRLNGSWERLDPYAPPDERDESDRRLVATKANARLNWAIGIMGTEDDERMKVDI